jgi:hypothetical protein
MTADDLKRIAERYSELMRPGEWPRMTDAQKPSVARLNLVRFDTRRALPMRNDGMISRRRNNCLRLQAQSI